MLSTQLRTLAMPPLATALHWGCGLVYSGAAPETTDHAATGTLLARITPADALDWAPGESRGLEFLAFGAWLIKSPPQAWVITGVATGTAGYCRFVGNAVDVGASLTLPRIDMAVSPLSSPTVGLVLPSLAITPALSREVQQFVFTIP